MTLLLTLSGRQWRAIRFVTRFVTQDVQWRRGGGVLLLLAIALHATTPVLQAADNVPACGFAEIRGVVTAGDSGLPLVDIDVASEGQTIREHTVTTAAGTYTLTLPVYQDQGPYAVTFVPPNGSPYLSLSPTTSQVISGATTTLNAVLPRGGAIVGQVKTADTDEPMAGVRIRASGQTILEDNDPLLTSTNTDADGRFVLRGLSNAAYVLRYQTNDLFSSEVISTYESKFVGGGNYLTTAMLFTVTVPNTTTVNFTIEQGKTLAGVVRRGDNNALADNVQVGIYLLDADGSGRGDFVQQDVTDAKGVYHFIGLAPGDYLLHARPFSVFGSNKLNLDLRPAWFDNVATSDEAQTVEIPAVSAAAVISQDLTLEVGAVITGVVTDATSGTPVAGIGVDVRPPLGLAEVTRNVFPNSTDAAGVYTLTGLYAGAYGILWSGGATIYRTVGANSFTGITLTVSSKETHPAANFTVARGGNIAGVLRDDKSNPLEGITVVLISPTTGKTLRTSATSDTGAYSFFNVAPGAYQIKYDRFDPCGCYNSAYYSGDMADEDGLVAVIADATTTGVNAQLGCNAPPALVETENLFLPRVQP